MPVFRSLPEFQYLSSFFIFSFIWLFILSHVCKEKHNVVIFVQRYKKIYCLQIFLIFVFMGILKIKDWFKYKSGKQFIIEEEDNGDFSSEIIRVTRIVDKASFIRDQIVLSRSHTNIQGKEFDVFVTINQFFKDEINVELKCEAWDYPLSRRIGIININNLKEYSFNMSENLIVDMDISFKERYGNIKS